MARVDSDVRSCFIVVDPFRFVVADIGEFLGGEAHCEVAVVPVGVGSCGGEVIDVEVFGHGVLRRMDR